MRLPTRYSSALFALSLTAGAVNADEGSFALGLKAGSTGVGLEATVGILPTVNLRGTASALRIGVDVEEEGNTYDGDLRVRVPGLLVDWHPYAGGLRLSAGLFHNGNRFKGTAEGDLDIGDSTYNVRLDATVDWRSTAPYLGIGYGNALRGGRWGVSADAGVLFTGSPDVRLSASGPGTSDPGFQDDLREEERQVREELKDLKYYPVLSLGLYYRF